MENAAAYIPLRMAVLTRLKAAIQDGTLKPGTVLSENKIAADYSVSRTPVREALRVLERERLVTTLPGRKVIVSMPRADEIDEIYGIRAILEAEALRRIGARPDLIAALEDCLERSGAALGKKEVRDLERINAEFHATLISALDSRRLRECMESVLETGARYRLYSLGEAGWRARGMREHRQLVSLVKKGDSEGAVKLLRRHLATGSEIVKKMFNHNSRPVHQDKPPGKRSTGGKL
jgi:DNA-binding GntR family transcriptional regulator